MIPLTEGRKEIILLFMDEARKKHVGTKSGFRPEHKDAIGLVEVSVAFEAFINELLYVKSIKRKREEFSTKYQCIFEKYKEGCKEEITALKNELDKFSLEDMTPNTTNPLIVINNPDELGEVIEVIYRVRSNFIHGSKTLDTPRNKTLIGNSFHLLYKIMDNVLREEGVIS